MTRQFEEGYFNKAYLNYERQNPVTKLKFYRLLAEQYASLPRPRILDVGCAFGKFLSSLNRNWERYGLDVSEFAITKAGQDFPDIDFQVASGTAIPFEGQFDMITAFDTIEHIPSLEEVATAIKAKLTLQGHFIFVVPVYDGLAGSLVAFLDKDPTHVHKHSRDFWLNWANTNFRVVNWQGIYRYLLPGGFYWHQPTSMLRRYTPAIVVVAQNK